MSRPNQRVYMCPKGQDSHSLESNCHSSAVTELTDTKSGVTKTVNDETHAAKVHHTKHCSLKKHCKCVKWCVALLNCC